MKFPFENAQSYAKLYPKTFEAPSKDELNNLKVDGYVKLCNSKERFWVKITQINENNIIGIIDNDLRLTYVHGLKDEDEVTFNREHIYNIIK